MIVTPTVTQIQITVSGNWGRFECNTNYMTQIQVTVIQIHITVFSFMCVYQVTGGGLNVTPTVTQIQITVSGNRGGGG